MTTMSDMTNQRWLEVGAALRRARGPLSQTEAAIRGHVSRQWWIDIEKGKRPPRPENLASAVLGVGGDLVTIFEIAGFDPEPYLDARPRDPGAEQGDVTQLLVDIASEVRGLQDEIRRLGDVVERLAASPRDQGGPSPEPAPVALAAGTRAPRPTAAGSPR